MDGKFYFDYCFKTSQKQATIRPLKFNTYYVTKTLLKSQWNVLIVKVNKIFCNYAYIGVQERKLSPFKL